MKFILGVLCLIIAIPVGYFLSPRHKKRQPGDMLIRTDAIGAAIGLIALGIILIVWSTHTH